MSLSRQNGPHFATFNNIVWKRGLTVISFALIFVAVLPTFTDPDLWGHVRFGIDMLDERSIV